MKKKEAKLIKKPRKGKRKAKAKGKKPTAPTVCGDGKVLGKEACDDKNKRVGDGCNNKCQVEKGWSCAGGSPRHRSVCDKCGNGVVGGQESCDDGNKINGDGCSTLCQVETGYTCQTFFSAEKSAQVSKCQPVAQLADKLLDVLDIKKRACQRRNKIFMMTDLIRGRGKCVKPPKSEASGGNINQLTSPGLTPTSPLVVEKTFLDGSALSVPNAVHTRIQTDAKCVKLGTLTHTVKPVCDTNSELVCLNTGENPWKRLCTVKRITWCKEVATPPRYCEDKKGNVHGTDLAGSSLRALSTAAAKAATGSPDISEQRFADKFRRKTLTIHDAVNAILRHDHDSNKAISFSEFLELLQTKPWTALLRKLTNLSVADVWAVSQGRGKKKHSVQLRELFDRFDIDGSLCRRSGFAGGKACCFKRCNTPPEWAIAPQLWCLEPHLAAWGFPIALNLTSA
jgi:cysteine-rich repeat protein